MLNTTPIHGNNEYAASHYFASGDDYYTKESPGLWFGQGAEALGLTGPIEQAEFARLLAGKLPNGERIEASFLDKEQQRRMGLDLTFSAPKSVSMQALIAGDRDVLAAHDRAVKRALEQVEPLAIARKRVKNKRYHERTGNMVIGQFRHEMSRAKDPQLHTHAVILNMTQRADGQWRALANDDVFRAYDAIDAVYKTELAKELRSLGYQIRVVDEKGNFELDHISREQILVFSERSRVIEEALASEGKTRATATTLEKQIISLATRPSKDESDRAIIKQYWVEKSRASGIDFGPRSQLGDYAPDPQAPSHPPPSAPGEPTLPPHVTPAQAVVEYAIRHLTEREAIVTESQLIAVATRRAVGLASASDVRAEIARLVAVGRLVEAPAAYRIAATPDGPALSAAGWVHHVRTEYGRSPSQARAYVADAIRQGSLVPVEKRFTTTKALKLEKAILAIELAGRHQLTPIRDAQTVRTALEGTTLNADQRQAVETIVSAQNRFVGIQGDAGTGKTFMVNKAVELIKGDSPGEGYRVVALAPYGNQVKALKAEGMEAHTLASFLKTKNKPIDERTVIVLDEAGVVGATNMAQLMRVVEAANARLVLLGDTKQMEAIEAGKPFAQLQEAGMVTSRISEIQRQKDPELKRAVEYAAEGQVGQSLQHVNHVEEIKDGGERHQAVVADYTKLPEADRAKALIVAGTNDSRREINAMVRDAIGLAGIGREYETLIRVDMTQAQRRFAPSYQPGMVVQPERDYARAGLVRGEIYKVREVLSDNRLLLAAADGRTVTINPRVTTKLSVYELEKAELSVGDTVRINRNDTVRDLTNGDRYRVASVTAGLVQLESMERKDGRPLRMVELPATRPLHLEHAYASTVHSAQGLTTDRVLAALDAHSRTTSMNLYYVAISRARYEGRVYTDSLADLPAAIARRYDKTTAMEIARERKTQRQAAALQLAPVSTERLAMHRTQPAVDGPKRRSGQADGQQGPGS